VIKPLATTLDSHMIFLGSDPVRDRAAIYCPHRFRLEADLQLHPLRKQQWQYNPE
jgi:hypothetical protein